MFQCVIVIIVVVSNFSFLCCFGLFYNFMYFHLCLLGICVHVVVLCLFILIFALLRCVNCVLFCRFMFYF